MTNYLKKILKISVLSGLFISISVFTFAEVNLDSLWGVWNDESAPDTCRAKAMQNISWDGYIFKKPDSAFYFAQLLYDFANEKSLKKEMAIALNAQGVSYYVRSDYEKALMYYQRCLKIREEISDKRGIAASLNNFGIIYSVQGNYTKAMEYYQRCLQISEVEISDKKLIANALKNIGKIHMIQGDYPKAINSYRQSLKLLTESSDKGGMAEVLSKFGSIYKNQGNYPKALDYYQKSLEIREEMADKRGMAGVLNNIGLIYMFREDFVKAQNHYQRSFMIKEEISDKNGMANTLNNLGLVNMKQGKFPEAISYYKQCLEIRKEISDKRGMAGVLNNIGEVFLNQRNYSKALDYYHRSLNINKEISDKRGMAVTSNNIGRIKNKQGNPKQAIIWCQEGLSKAQEIKIFEVQKNACKCLYDAYKAMGNNKRALVYHEHMSIMDDSLQAKETTKKLQQMEFSRQLMLDSLAKEKEKLKIQIAHDAEVRKKTKTRNIYIITVLFLLVVASGLFGRMVRNRRARKAIQDEQERSDKLLLNILPAEIARELKEKGKTEPRKFEAVTILFSDFKEFTQISEKLSAEELVGEINICFESFDIICEKHGIEKIKTIGDSYMAAGGLPAPKEDSVKNTVLAGLEMIEFMIKRKEERKKEGKVYFEMRVGIHTGPIVAGIVGITKFQYDIWGESVNTASRIETSGEVGRVNISQFTFEPIKDDPIFNFHSRGKVKVKGKGEIEMWFVEKNS